MMKLRRWIQSFSLFGLSLGPLFQAKWLCVPILHCHSCPLASFSCPIGIIGYYLSIGMIPIFLLGTILLFGALLGRALCGWVCPFGFLQELLYKIPSPKFKLWRPLGYGKYLSLFLLVIAVPLVLGTESIFYFCRLCPAAAIEASLPYAVMQGGFTSFWGPMIRFSLFGVIILFVITTQRFFCRVLCPVGAMTSFFNPISAFALRQKTQDCPACGECSQACPVDIDLSDKKQDEGQEYTYKAPADCILCLNCTHACHLSNGLKGSFAGMAKNEEE